MRAPIQHRRAIQSFEIRDTATANTAHADTNSFGADPEYDGEPDWSALAPERISRHVRWNDDPTVPPVADRRPAQLMQRSGFHDAAPTLGVPWQATGGHRGDWRRREDVFWTTRPAALRGYRVIDTAAARALSDHLPIVVELDPQALAEAPLSAVDGRGTLAGQVTP
jgi:hypothetical protein